MLLERMLDTHRPRTRHPPGSILVHALVPLVDAVSLVGVAAAFSITVMALLLWRSGRRLTDKAESLDERMKAHKVIAATVLTALRLSKPSTILGELGDSAQASVTHLD
jgi:hypothetical protein